MSDVFKCSITYVSDFHHVGVRPADEHTQNTHGEGLGRSDHLLQTSLPDWRDIYSLRRTFGGWVVVYLRKWVKNAKIGPKTCFFALRPKNIYTISP